MASEETQERKSSANGDAAKGEAAPRSPDEGRGDEPPKRPFFRRPAGLFVIGLVIVGAAVGVIWHLYARQFESTDDAFIDGSAVAISPKVAGTVERVLVNDNQDVTAGQLLVEIDPRDIRARLDRAIADRDAAKSKRVAAQTSVELTRANTAAALAQAEAGVKQAQAGVTAAEAQLASAQADVAAAEAEANRRAADLKRFQALDPRSVSQQQIDVARAASESAQANLTAARKRVAGGESAVAEATAKVTQAQAMRSAAQTAPQQVAAAEAQAKTAQAAVEEADAAVRELQLQLSYTTITAPVAGRVTKKAINPGQNVQVGSPLLAIVQPDVWVTANYKETQLTHMRRGQDVDIEVDAYPGRSFHGKVDSIQAGTGSRFSLMPAENATGNYVKVVQRVPVKIVFDRNDQTARQLLALGMSVVPTVRIATDQDDVAPLPVKSPATPGQHATTQAAGGDVSANAARTQ
jgi:membrane fusion protein (multidrug efflux system)